MSTQLAHLENDPSLGQISTVHRIAEVPPLPVRQAHFSAELQSLEEARAAWQQGAVEDIDVLMNDRVARRESAAQGAHLDERIGEATHMLARLDAERASRHQRLLTLMRGSEQPVARNDAPRVAK